MHLFRCLMLLEAASAFSHNSPRRRSSGETLFIADEGVGHRSNPVPQWRTSIRQLNLNSNDTSTIESFGPTGSVGSPPQPIGASALAYEPSSRKLYVATGEGIIRTNLNGSNAQTIITENNTSVRVESLHINDGKLYYGTSFEGLIKRANLDGSNVEVLFNVSLGINYNIIPSYKPSYSYAAGIAVDQQRGYIYWSAHSAPADLSSHLPQGGSIRRTQLSSTHSISSSIEGEVLVQGIYSPSQMRLLGPSTIYWVERGQYINDPTAIRRGYFPEAQAAEEQSAIQTIVHSDSTDLLPRPYGIESFVVDKQQEGDGMKLWLCAMSDAAIMYGRIIEMDVKSGTMKVLNSNTTEIGVPVGLEYVA